MTMQQLTMQLDIFADSRDVMLRNDVLDALHRRHSGDAREAWQRLAGEFPDDGSLPGLATLIEVLEDALGKKAVRRFVAAQACEVQAAVADASDLERDTGYATTTPLEAGVGKFVAWYRDYYKV